MYRWILSKSKFFEYIDNQISYLRYVQELHYGVAI